MPVSEANRIVHVKRLHGCYSDLKSSNSRIIGTFSVRLPRCFAPRNDKHETCCSMVDPMLFMYLSSTWVGKDSRLHQGG